MLRRIIQIDEKRCNGCGLCANACHEHAIAIVDGKARLIKDDYCDGLGDCLPHCPMDAISFVVREAAAYDEEAVKARIAAKKAAASAPSLHTVSLPTSNITKASSNSCLKQWPVQIKLAPVEAAFYHQAKILIAADCTAYAYANFHQDFILGRVTLIGCTKLDNVAYAEKLSAIFALNDIKDILVVKMDVPCCGGMEKAVVDAVNRTTKQLDVTIVTVSKTGQILERRRIA